MLTGTSTHLRIKAETNTSLDLIVCQMRIRSRIILEDAQHEHRCLVESKQDILALRAKRAADRWPE